MQIFRNKAIVYDYSLVLKAFYFKYTYLFKKINKKKNLNLNLFKKEIKKKIKEKNIEKLFKFKRIL